MHDIKIELIYVITWVVISKVALLKSLRDNVHLMNVGTVEEIIYATQSSNDSVTNMGTHKEDVGDHVMM